MSIESIANAVSSQKQVLVQQEVGTQVLKKALDIQLTQGLQMVQMMNQSSGVGTGIDTLA